MPEKIHPHNFINSTGKELNSRSYQSVRKDISDLSSLPVVANLANEIQIRIKY